MEEGRTVSLALKSPYHQHIWALVDLNGVSIRYHKSVSQESGEQFYEGERKREVAIWWKQKVQI